MGIASNIKRIREDNDLTQEELGKIAGVSSMAVSQWENSRAVPRMGAVERIANHFGISKGEVIDEDSSVRRIPVTAGERATVPLLTLGRVHAGDPTDEEEVSERVDVPAVVLDGHPRSFALVVEGDCMDRVVPEGAHVLVDPDVEPHNGSVAVCELDAGVSVMRRWQRGQSTLMLVADSFSKHEDIVITGDKSVRVLGTVVWFQASREME
jgi:repressor LexA